MRCRGTPGTCRWHCSQSCQYSVKTTWHPRWNKYLLKTSGKEIAETLTFKMSPMPRPYETCAFGASSKATYYSLSACYLKHFWQSWSYIHIFCKFTGICSVQSIWSPSQIFCIARKNSVSANVSYEWEDCKVKLEE